MKLTKTSSQWQDIADTLELQGDDVPVEDERPYYYDLASRIREVTDDPMIHEGSFVMVDLTEDEHQLVKGADIT